MMRFNRFGLWVLLLGFLLSALPMFQGQAEASQDKKAGRGGIKGLNVMVLSVPFHSVRELLRIVNIRAVYVEGIKLDNIILTIATIVK